MARMQPTAAEGGSRPRKAQGASGPRVAAAYPAKPARVMRGPSPVRNGRGLGHMAPAGHSMQHSEGPIDTGLRLLGGLQNWGKPGIKNTEKLPKKYIP